MRVGAMYKVSQPDPCGPPGITLSQYAEDCCQAIDKASDWPTRRTTPNARITCGYHAKNPHYLTLMWTQTLSNSPGTEEAMARLFAGDDFGDLAARWDSTYIRAELLGRLPFGRAKGLVEDAMIIQRQHRAGPLQQREMLYVVATKDTEATKDEQPFSKQTTYALASVSEAWVEKALPHAVITVGEKVRSHNMIPSASRVTTSADGATVRVDHMMTTKIGGWVPNFVFNNFFKAALLEMYATDAEKWRTCCIALAAEMA